MIARFGVSAFALISICGVAFADEAPPASHWDRLDIEQLLDAADVISESGLSPGDYDFESLARVAADGDAARTDAAASALFSKLATDLASGATPVDERVRWRIAGPAIDPINLTIAVESATANDAVLEVLASFEPPHAAYRALKAAMRAAEGDDGLKATIAINLDRWRWMPRELGSDYILVNAPAYDAIVVRAGEEVARNRVIVGAKKTPTWQFSALVTGVAFNPTWFVPQSIVAESVGVMLEKRPKDAARLGYYVAEDGGVRQKPGPDNALGEMKFLMPNPYGIFLHDTPARQLFDREKRALSHGCIRVEDAVAFARAVLGSEWSEETIDGVVATNETATVDLAAPIPVYVVYFTTTVDKDGNLVRHPDIYGLDKALRAHSTLDAIDVAASAPLENCRGV